MSDSFAMIKNALEDIGVPSADIRTDSTFDELLIDSLTLVELVLIVKEEHGVDVDELSVSATIGEAAAVLDRLRAEAGEAAGTAGRGLGVR